MIEAPDEVATCLLYEDTPNSTCKNGDFTIYQCWSDSHFRQVLKTIKSE